MDRRIVSLFTFFILATLTSTPGLAGMRGFTAPFDSSPIASCERADLAALEPGSAMETGPLAAGESHCVSITTPEAGLLLLGATAQGESWGEARLEARSCSSELEKRSIAESWLATPVERIFHVSGPARFLACVRLQGRQHRAEASSLRAVFVPDGEAMAELLEPVPDKNQQIEVEPDGLVSGPGGETVVALLDPVPDKNQQIEVEPDGMVAPAPVRWQCPGVGSGLGDDHGDFTACASTLRLQETVRGHLAAGPDLDIFAFRLDALDDVAFALRKDGEQGRELRLELLDESGHRLAVLAGGGERMKSLAAGLYFLRISGSWGESTEYELQLSVR